MSQQLPNELKNHPSTHAGSNGKFTMIAAIIAALIAALIALRGFGAHADNLYALIAARPTWILGCLPFVALLLAIAIVPMIPSMEHWWERNSSKLLVSCALGIAALVWLASEVSVDAAATAAMHGLNEYVPFIILLLSLFMISGGISMGGSWSCACKSSWHNRRQHAADSSPAAGQLAPFVPHAYRGIFYIYCEQLRRLAASYWRPAFVPGIFAGCSI